MKGQYIKAGGTQSSWKEAMFCAMKDIAKDNLQNNNMNDFGFVPNVNHLRMKPKTFYESLPKCVIIHI